MTEELEQLKRDYRAIKAPPHLATRIRASIGDERRPSSRWLPAIAATAIAVAAVGLFPLIDQPSGAAPLKPSLSTLATLKPEKPAVPAPSFSKLRSVSVPRMPAKPKPPKPPKPRTNQTSESEYLKEKDHANV